MADSPRWCKTCMTYGDHHTDRHPSTEDEKLREALAGTWMDTPSGRLMAGPEIGEWIDALLPAILADREKAMQQARVEAWDEGHAAGRDYQGDGWNSDAHDPREDNPYREAQP